MNLYALSPKILRSAYRFCTGRELCKLVQNSIPFVVSPRAMFCQFLLLLEKINKANAPNKAMAMVKVSSKMITCDKCIAGDNMRGKKDRKARNKIT